MVGSFYIYRLKPLKKPYLRYKTTISHRISSILYFFTINYYLNFNYKFIELDLADALIYGRIKECLFYGQSWWLVRVGGTSSLGELAQDTWKCQRLGVESCIPHRVTRLNETTL
jgi:hypothetical protein